MFKEKFRIVIKYLYDDDRKISKRILLAFLASFAFVLTFMICAPLDVYFDNTMHFEYTVDEVLPTVLLWGLGVFAVLFGLSFALRGRIFNWYVTLIGGLSLASYVQLLFMNQSVGLLDGNRVEWEHQTTAMVVGIGVWAVIIIGLYVLLFLKKKIWNYAITFVCILISVMQLAGTMGVALTTEIKENSNIAVTRNGEMEFSDKHNVILIVLDRFDIEYANEVMENDPQYFDEFDGFTWYKNTISHFTRTFPNVFMYFTDEKYMFDVPYDEYMKTAWEDNPFLEDIAAAGYTSRVYVKSQYVNSDLEYMKEYCSNYVESERNVDKLDLEKNMMKLSLFRTLPVALKPDFETSTTELNSAFSLGEENELSTIDCDFYQRLKEQGITVSEGNENVGENGTFTYYHFLGCHTPYYFDENCIRQDELTDITQATRGALTNVGEILRQLKEQGIYDNSTIFVTADHGVAGNFTELDDKRVMSLFYKPANSRGEMKISNSPQQLGNVRATVIKSMGLDYSQYGTPLDEVAEDADIKRYFYMSACNEDVSIREYELLTYEVTGDANDFKNWKLIERNPIKYPFL